jgi:hypothetical protein
MPFYPDNPLPSSVSAPAIIDPVHRFETDQGIAIRRAKHSRPLRRYTLEYQGKTVTEMRTVRDFMQYCRLSALPFQWTHPTASDLATVDDQQTPVVLYYPHGLVTGQWVGIVGGPAHINGFWQVTRLHQGAVTLNGSVAGGPVSQCHVVVFLPNAVGVFANDTMESPEKIIGPEQWYPQGIREQRVGYFSFSVLIEEIF